MLTHSIAFVLGFSFVFIILGISSSMIGEFLSTYQTYISRIGGILLIVMGLFSLNLIKIPFLNQEKMIQLKKKPLGFFGSFIVGIAFSLGWTPCIGPALSSILIIASTEESTWKGAYLFSMYSLGFAVPFILSALLFDQLLRFIKRYGYIVKYTMKIMGVLLIIIGLLLVTANFHRFSNGWNRFSKTKDGHTQIRIIVINTFNFKTTPLICYKKQGGKKMEKIGIIGLGNMGESIVKALIEPGVQKGISSLRRKQKKNGRPI